MSKSWQGFWWRPDAPDNPQAGILTEQPAGGTLLSLIGGFDLSIRTPLRGGGFSVEQGTQQLPLLQGRCGSTRITLVDVICRSSRGGNLTPDEQILAPGTALIGIALADVDDPIFHTTHLRLENLLPWLDLGGMEVKRSVDGSTSTATVTRTAPMTAHDDGWTISGRTVTGGFQAEHLQDATSIRAEVRAFLSVQSPEPVSYRGFNEISHALNDLLTLAGDSPSGLLSRSLDYPLPPTAPMVVAGLAYDDNAEVIARRIFQATPGDTVTSPFLFTCRDLPFDVLVERWLRLRRLAVDACNILFGTLYSRPTYTEIRLLNIGIAAEALHRALFPHSRPMTDEQFTTLQMAALDGLSKPDRGWLHRRLHNELSYVERLLHLADLPDQTAVTQLIPDRETWAKQLKEARNGMAHTARPRVSSGALFELTEVSRYLLYLVLMQQLGLTGEIQQRALQQNQYLSHFRHERT